DHVDVIAVPPRASDAQPQAFTILRDIEVMAMGSQLEVATATPPPGVDADPRTVTLEVTPHQADLLAMADLNSTLRLALRSPQEPARSQSAERLVFATQTQSVSVSQPRMPEPVRLAAPPPQQPQRPVVRRNPSSAVMVIDGDRISDSGTGDR
ncbi:MAG: RcpC/CpaB family pilus assembly protein, partial [Candidatus Eremiobacteraeota bacterium]|nr:RcpC/CpaB family pilus assembly protein [Candidatus Eremiobacteraeota bacterium]